MTTQFDATLDGSRYHGGFLSQTAERKKHKSSNTYNLSSVEKKIDHRISFPPAIQCNNPRSPTISVALESILIAQFGYNVRMPKMRSR